MTSCVKAGADLLSMEEKFMSVDITITIAIIVVWLLAVFNLMLGFIFAIPGNKKVFAGLAVIRWMMPTIALEFTVVVIYGLHWIWT